MQCYRIATKESAHYYACTLAEARTLLKELAFITPPHEKRGLRVDLIDVDIAKASIVSFLNGSLAPAQAPPLRTWMLTASGLGLLEIGAGE